MQTSSDPIKVVLLSFCMCHEQDKGQLKPPALVHYFIVHAL